ncbi:hypothetical protein GCM10007938_03620 [Vibrio zhanjiangensis]|uniref:Uncharacterized protein n=1 Tax=Vibrio zhanjiangensis TaxID=1046128 RepID=A0ABQ6EV57_9VIBR|nr:hypothetical protein [Vibrio zhanjiangensis]GLT16586.1 hypothetical protein GCM10007938_03620 [Vibrio zhanjiangensis]
MTGPVTTSNITSTTAAVNQGPTDHQFGFSIKKIVNLLTENLPSFPNLKPNKFDNNMPTSFSGEVNESNLKSMLSEYSEGKGPFGQGSDGFHQMINSGNEFKWVLNRKGLSIISPELKHSVAAGGVSVISAGTGKLIESGKIWINNDTGHYKTTIKSLSSTLPSWKEVGYEVEIRERRDFAAAFKNF